MSVIEKVLTVQHFNDKLFKFTTTKSPGFKFIPGQFTMIGLPSRGDDVMRAYSICSSPDAPHLEFYSIKAPGGVFTSDLQRIIPGDEIEVSDRPVGSLLVDNLKPGKRLWMLATGTGIAPFMSIIRSGEHSKFSNPYPFLVHSCRTDDEHAYRDELEHQPVIYLESTTREVWPECWGFLNKRITTSLYDDTLCETAKQAVHYMRGFDMECPLSPEHDRIMLCGNEDFIAEMKSYLLQTGWEFGTRKNPGTFVYEKAFVG